MENGAKGVEVIISGKLRAQRAKAWNIGIRVTTHKEPMNTANDCKTTL